MKISFTAEEFNPGVLQLGTIDVLWPDLVWAAITYGKKNSFPWNSFAGFARAEKKYRTYLLYSCLREVNGRAVMSQGYRDMDSTEKGATSYFLGMTLAKLTAERLFSVPWLWHISCASQALSFLKGKSRPDMLGCDLAGKWIVVEAKGRSGNLDMDALESAKYQTRMVSTVNAVVPYCRMGVQAYFDPDLKAYLLDPAPLDTAKPVEFKMVEALDDYYGFRHILSRSGKQRRVLGVEYLVIEEEDIGVTVGLPKTLVENYENNDIAEILKDIPARYVGSLSFATAENIKKTAQAQANDVAAELLGDENLVQNLPQNSGIYADGFFIELDYRWSSENMASEPEERI